MQPRLCGRAAAVLALVLVQVGFVAWFGSVGYGGDPYPGTDELAADYDHYLGHRVVVYGQIAATDPVRIDPAYGDGERITLTLVDAPAGVTEGQYVDAFAVVRPDRRLAVRRAVVVRERGHWWAYGASLLAGLWVLGRARRDWRFDAAAGGFVPRRDRSTADSRGDTDA